MIDLVSDLSGATERGEMVAFYQPQVDISSLEIVAVEALVRWFHPVHGLVPPDVFIPLAEANELIEEVGCFMIDEGTRCAAQWRSLGVDVQVAINVSPVQLEALDCLDTLQTDLDRYALPAERIVIEITESLPLSPSPAVIAKLRELTEQGLGLSVDDFGVRHKSLADVEVLPVTEIKIDRSLIQDPAATSGFLRRVVGEAHERGLRVVAEGIETAEHLEAARKLACDRVQGYRFGRPVREAEMTAVLTARQ
jgi:EAL domain-containing protein (putative c-di-GMP-specific phosphodiesterase class I)